MIEQINKILGETSKTALTEIYTSLFYSCFADVSAPRSYFSQSTKSFNLTKNTASGFIEVKVAISSASGKLPTDHNDSIKLFELLRFPDGNKKSAEAVSSMIEFNVLPKDFLETDEWLKRLSSIFYDIDIKSSSSLDGEIKETFSAGHLKIIEEYKVKNVPLIETVSDSAINTSSRTPVTFTVKFSGWIVEALSEDYLALSVMDKLLLCEDLLPILR